MERLPGGMLGAESFAGKPMRKYRRRKWTTSLVEFVFPVAVLAAAHFVVVAEATVVTTVPVVAS